MGSFCFSISLQMQQLLPESWRRENMQIQVSSQKSHSPIITPSWYIQNSLFWTPKLLQRRSDPSLWLSPEVYHPSFRLYPLKMDSLVNSRDSDNIDHLLWSSAYCPAHPCRWSISFLLGLCEMCISLYLAPKLRCRIQHVEKLWYVTQFVHSDLPQELVEQVEIKPPKGAMLKP